MDTTARFSEAVRRWEALIQAAPSLAADALVDALTLHLAHLYAEALHLRCTEPRPDRRAPPAWPTTWPGLGALDDTPPPLTMLLQGIGADLASGLAWLPDSPEQALAWWASTFEERWGTLILAALPRLHRARLALPLPESPPATWAVAAPSTAAPLLAFEPAPPERRSTGRERPAVVRDGILGVRGEPEPHGVRVYAVHPAGPAAGQILPGDLLIRIDETPLQRLSPAQAQGALASEAGVVRTLTVARDDATLSFEVVAVTPDDLASARLTWSLRLLDRPAALPILEALSALGATVERPDEESDQATLSVGVEAMSAVQTAIAQGEAHGWWEPLDAD